MRRPRGHAKERELDALRAEAPWARIAWEIGRVYRRTDAGLRNILDNSTHRRVVPIRAGDPRVARQQLDRHLQEQLRKCGSFDEEGLIFGGETQVAHRPFQTETIDAIRDAHHALHRAIFQATFSSQLERVAFHHSPKDPRNDRGDSTEAMWHDAWLEITYGTYTKAVACKAIGISQHAYDERQRRRRVKAGGLSIRDEKRNTMLGEQVAEERKGIENLREYREYIGAIASARGQQLPRALRFPRFTKATCKRLPTDTSFYVKELQRWQAQLARQPRNSRKLWRELVELRQERIAEMVAALEISGWADQHLKNSRPWNES